MRPDNSARKRAFTLVEMMIVVLIIGILLEIAIPSFFSARTQAYIQSCTKNLSNIDSAKSQYAMNNQLAQGSNVHNGVDLVPAYMQTWPSGPTNGDYEANPVGANPTYNGEDFDWYRVHCVSNLDSACPF